MNIQLKFRKDIHQVVSNAKWLLARRTNLKEQEEVLHILNALSIL